MTHFHPRHVSPEFVRLVLACAASIALVAAIYLADSSLWQRDSFAGPSRVAPPIPAASGAASSPDRAGGVVAVAEPPASAAPVVQATPEPLSRYTVKPGDSLIPIALYFGVHTEDLIALNKLPPDGFLYAGQELMIPRGPVASPTAER